MSCHRGRRPEIGAWCFLIRSTLRDAGADVGVIVSDTFGRAWREAQTDIAIGVAGLVALGAIAERIVQYVGNDLNALTSEVTKLCAFAGGGEITAELV